MREMVGWVDGWMGVWVWGYIGMGDTGMLGCICMRDRILS